MRHRLGAGCCVPWRPFDLLQDGRPRFGKMVVGGGNDRQHSSVLCACLGDRARPSSGVGQVRSAAPGQWQWPGEENGSDRRQALVLHFRRSRQAPGPNFSKREDLSLGSRTVICVGNGLPNAPTRSLVRLPPFGPFSPFDRCGDTIGQLQAMPVTHRAGLLELGQDLFVGDAEPPADSLGDYRRQLIHVHRRSSRSSRNGNIANRAEILTVRRLTWASHRRSDPSTLRRSLGGRRGART